MSKQGHSQEQIDRKLERIESWKDTITTNKKWLSYGSDTILGIRNKQNRKLMSNNIQIAEHQIRILESQLMVDKIRKENYKIKTNLIIERERNE